MSDTEKCKQMIRDNQRSSRFHVMRKRCEMNATTAAGYCRMHDPELRELADKKRMEKYHEKWDAEARRARLNAAATDLLAACEEALPHHQGGHSSVGALLRAAIAKAKGESVPCRNCGCSPCAPTCVVADSVGRKK